MNGPQHYRWAEAALDQSRVRESDPEEAALLIAEAQVHATLALAAAQLDTVGELEHVDEAKWAWAEAFRGETS